MTGWIIAACVLTAALLVLIAFGIVWLVRDARAARGIRVVQIGEGSYLAHTPLGRATGRAVVAEERGRVIEVTTHFRGHPETVHYVPPTAHMMRVLVEREVTRLAQRPTRLIRRNPSITR